MSARPNQRHSQTTTTTTTPRTLRTVSGRRTRSPCHRKHYCCSTLRPVVVREANEASAESVLKDQYCAANLARLPRAVNTVQQQRGRVKALMEDR